MPEANAPADDEQEERAELYRRNAETLRRLVAEVRRQMTTRLEGLPALPNPGGRDPAVAGLVVLIGFRHAAHGGSGHTIGLQPRKFGILDAEHPSVLSVKGMVQHQEPHLNVIVITSGARSLAFRCSR